MPDNPYPECAKLVSSNFGDLEEFMDWLAEREKPIELYQWDGPNDNHAVPCPTKARDLIYEFLGIDFKKLVQERQAMVDTL